MTTVYKIVNKITNQVYIGITDKNVEKRWDNHKNNSQNPHLRKSVEQYGVDSFKFSVLCEVDKRSDALDIEDDYMKKYNTIYPNGLNYRYNSGKYTKGEIKKLTEIAKGIRKKLIFKITPYKWLSKETGVAIRKIYKNQNRMYMFSNNELQSINKVLKTEFKN
jgi:group I intron endonuclease